MTREPTSSSSDTRPRRSLSADRPSGTGSGPTSRGPTPAHSLLLEEALGVAERAYAPYSGYSVGAVAVGPSGRSYHGVNVENASSPAGLCAERAALAALVTAGEREVLRVAVAAQDGSDCLPCGLCLQALSELGDPELVMRRGGQIVAIRLHELLTAPFSLPREAGGD